MNNTYIAAKDAYYYARDVIKGRWLEGETIIITDPCHAYRYALDVVEGRFEAGEPIIATVSKFAFWYARGIVKGRWLTGELTIMFSEYASDYAQLCGMELYEYQ